MSEHALKYPQEHFSPVLHNCLNEKELKTTTQTIWQKARQFSKLAKVTNNVMTRQKLYREKHRLISLAIEKTPELIMVTNKRGYFWALYCEEMGVLHVDPKNLSQQAHENLETTMVQWTHNRKN